MENGLTNKLTNSVTPMPRHWLFAWARAAKSIFTSHEDDHDPDQHRHRQVDMGNLHAADCVGYVLEVKDA
jgi:hypothetical protein